MTPNLYEEHLRQMHGLSDTWHVCEMSCRACDAPAGFIKLSGYECPSRAGKPQWNKPVKGTDKVFFLNIAEHNAWVELGVGTPGDPQ